MGHDLEGSGAMMRKKNLSVGMSSDHSHVIVLVDQLESLVNAL